MPKTYKKHLLYKDIPEDKKREVVNDFYSRHDNEVTKIAKRHGLIYWMALKIIDRFKKTKT